MVADELSLLSGRNDGDHPGAQRPAGLNRCGAHAACGAEHEQSLSGFQTSAFPQAIIGGAEGGLITRAFNETHAVRHEATGGFGGDDKFRQSAARSSGKHAVPGLEPDDLAAHDGNDARPLCAG